MSLTLECVFNPKLYFKDNVHFIEQGNAKLASSILATINDNITLPALVKSIITNYKNAVSFSFEDVTFPPLPSPALLNHRSVGINVGDPASNITKSVHEERNSMSVVGLVRAMSVMPRKFKQEGNTTESL